MVRKPFSFNNDSGEIVVSVSPTSSNASAIQLFDRQSHRSDGLFAHGANEVRMSYSRGKASGQRLAVAPQ
jgi:hypothetical protein